MILIPSTNDIFSSTFEFTVKPTKQYKLHTERNRIAGYCDGLEALKQTIYHILLTERYRYLIYSWNYGIELEDLYGMPVNYICLELQRRITEALTQDDRINSVDSFSFEIPNKKTIHVTFTAHTIYGDIETEKAVNI